MLRDSRKFEETFLFNYQHYMQDIFRMFTTNSLILVNSKVYRYYDYLIILKLFRKKSIDSWMDVSIINLSIFQTCKLGFSSHSTSV